MNKYKFSGPRKKRCAERTKDVVIKMLCRIVASIQALRRRSLIPLAVTNKQEAIRIEATSLEITKSGLTWVPNFLIKCGIKFTEKKPKRTKD